MRLRRIGELIVSCGVMHAQNLILVLVATAVGLVFIFAHPRRQALLHTARCFVALCAQRVRTRIERLLRVGRIHDRTSFWIGFGIGLFCAVFCILVPSRRVLGDIEVIGFPFIFRISGGYVFVVYWHWFALFADLLFAGISAVVAGYAAVGVRAILSHQRGTV